MKPRRNGFPGPTTSAPATTIDDLLKRPKPNPVPKCRGMVQFLVRGEPGDDAFEIILFGLTSDEGRELVEFALSKWPKPSRIVRPTQQ